METPVQSSRSRVPLLAACVVGATAFALYLPALRGEFVFDDPVYVRSNPYIQSLSVDTVRWALTESHHGNWHPITWMSHALDVALFGENPVGHHVVSLLVHAVNSALLLLLLARMTGRVWPAAFVAAVFAMHPLQVESVAWISERKTLLCTMFSLLCLLAYVAYARRPGPARYALVFVSLLAALMSKQMAVTIPCLLLLLDYWPLHRFSLRAVLEKVPLLLLSVAASWMAWNTQQTGRAVTPLSIIGLDLRVANIVLSLSRYVGKLIVPVRLSPLYPYPGMEAPPWPAGITLTCTVLVLGMCVLAFVLVRRAPWLFVGWFWFVGMLVPVLGIVQIGRQAMADRFMYLPAVGLLIVLVGCADVLLGRRRWVGPSPSEPVDQPFASESTVEAFAPGRSGPPSAAPAILALLLLAGCCVLTVRQIGVWHDNETFWRHVLALAPGSPTARFGLAGTLIRKSAGDEQDACFTEARSLLEDAIALEKDQYQHIKMRIHLAELLSRKRLYEEAIPHLEFLVEKAPQEAAYRGLLAFNQEQAAPLAVADAERNRLQESARANYLWALGMRAPTETMADIHGHYAAFLSRAGLIDEGIAEYRRAIGLYPTQKLYLALIATLERTGRQAEAGEARRQMEFRFPGASAASPASP
ncbi:MAG: hypothetical protein IT449_01630 [Phycisphaerales bacterium]|nr:hypothetical protein [Phycisphaerales bacterium]